VPAQLAILLCFVGVLVLFYLDRERSVRTSRALWVPVIWIAVVGSRPVSDWLGIIGVIAPPDTPSTNLEGSPMDAAIYGALTAIGIAVLIARREKTGRYLAVIAPIIAYSIYCLMSVMWSPVPVPAIKRWTKDVGDMVMVLIIATDPRPLAALRRLYSRIGFLLFPLSVVLIRYTTVGRRWNNDGLLMITGVSDDKNMFGLIVFVISLGAFWNFRRLLMNKGEPHRSRRLVAEGTLLVFGLALLDMAHSSTSRACFALGSGLILTTHLRAIRCRPSRMHSVCLALVLAGALILVFGGQGNVAHALGRESSFSGRTDIWAALIPAVTNPMIGVGFESFWNSPNVLIFQRGLARIHWYHPELLNEAHNGYLEVYLNLGWIGVGLILLILTTGYSRACKVVRRDRELGGLTLAYIITGAVYSITEAGFRIMDPMWIFILLAVVVASGANARLFGEERGKLNRPSYTV
jgi:exopolysaccharide production protein ExoQ